MQIPVALKSRFFRRTPRIPSDRGSVALNIMIGMIVMMLVTYEIAKTLSPALHTISAHDDVRRAGTIANLANSYIAQTGDMQPTIAKLVAGGFLSGTSKGVCASCNGVGTVTTDDGSVLSLVPGPVGGVYGMTLLPGPNMNQDMNYYLSHLMGSVQNGSLVAWNQPVPAIANLGTRFVQTNPANPGATQTVESPLSTGNNTISTGGIVSAGTVNSGSVNTGPINSGSVNTGNVNTNGLNLNGWTSYQGGGVYTSPTGVTVVWARPVTSWTAYPCSWPHWGNWGWYNAGTAAPGGWWQTTTGYLNGTLMPGGYASYPSDGGWGC